MTVDWEVVATGAVAAGACALPGTFLVLRGMSLIGDAISHAVLPGIVVAVLLTGNVASLTVVGGAAAVGLLTVFLIETLIRTRRVKEDTSIAIVFPALFALGVLLIARYVPDKDLDQECVLYGEIAFVGLRTVPFAGMTVPEPLLTLGAIALLNLAFVLLFFKELKLATFDTGLAAAVGISPVLVHYLLMGTVSLTTVASFDAVGAILVVAFLIVPPAAAYLLTDRLGWMLVLAVAIGAGSAAGGYFFARALGDASVAGCMAVVMGAAFGLVWMLAPREGILGRVLRVRRNRRRFARALVLSRLGRGPADAATIAADLAWPRSRVDDVCASLESRGLVTTAAGTLTPTDAGRAYIAFLVKG